MDFIQARAILVSQCGQKIFTPRDEKPWHANDSWQKKSQENHEKVIQLIEDLERRGKFPQAS